MPKANNLSWSWNKIPNYLRHSPRVAEVAEDATAVAAVAAEIMAVLQTTVAAHAKAAAAVAAAVVAVAAAAAAAGAVAAMAAVVAAAVAETPPSERKTLPKLQQMGGTFPCRVFLFGSNQKQMPCGMEGKACSLTGARLARR